MADEPTDVPDEIPVPPGPSAAVRALDRLVGEWEVTGGAEGTVRYEWMEGGYFLLQHIDLEHHGERATGLELIGQLRRFGEDPSEEVHSRLYDNAGNTFDYVYALDGDTLTIWAGERDSPAFFRGTFTDDDRVLTGGWEFPGGGGYASIATRRDD